MLPSKTESYLTVYATNGEYAVDLTQASDNPRQFITTPEGKEEKVLQVVGDHNHVMVKPDGESKCPICGATTTLVSKKASIFAYGQCERGHTYMKGQAMKVVSASVDVHNTSPINDDKVGDPHSAPPAIPFPAKVSPKSSQPDSRTPGDNSTQDEDYDEYVSSDKLGDKQPKDGDMLEREKRSSNPPQAQIKNPDAGLAPNPDNDTSIPKGGAKQTKPTVLMGFKQDVDSFDNGSPAPIKDKPTFLSDDPSDGPRADDKPILTWQIAGLEIDLDESGTVAKWPLSFREIERDFKRPNKQPGPVKDPQKGGSQDSEKDNDENRPYQAILPDTKR